MLERIHHYLTAPKLSQVRAVDSQFTLQASFPSSMSSDGASLSQAGML